MPPAKIISGSMNFNGVNLLALNNDELRKIRGKDISMIFQEPITALNPVISIGEQIMESLRLHLNMNNAQAKARATELLQLVGIQQPQEKLRAYPHHLSGGMR